jgi:mitochondrial fission protein ELM1
MGAYHGDSFDLAVAPAYARLYPDPRRVETAAPLTRVCPSALESAAVEWKGVLEGAPAPRIALLVGGNDPAHELTPELARRMGREAAQLAESVGGSLFVTTSRRTPRAAADALEEALGGSAAHFHRWARGQDPLRNPYMGYLALADALIVTGESASMLAEACATGKPVYIYPLPEVSRGPKRAALRLLLSGTDAIAARAFAQPTNRRGIARPQRGLELLCANLVARGLVPLDAYTRSLHEVLVERGLAYRFEGRLSEAHPGHLSEVVRVADRVRTLLGVPIQHEIWMQPDSGGSRG